MGQYTYDGNGKRIKKVENGTTTYYSYDITGNNVIAELVDSQWTKYIAGINGNVAKIDAAGAVVYYHNDHLGSTRMITDSSGNVVKRINNDAFGSPLAGYDHAGIEGGKDYTGKELDEASGLYYFGARYYDAEIGRFITEDPVKDGLNWYIYAYNNPLRYIDPTGLANIVVIIGLPGDAGDNFEIAANTWIGENSISSDTVVTINAADYNSIGNLMAAVENAFGDVGIDKMAYFGHSYSGGLSVFYGNSNIDNRWIDSNTDWSGVTFNSNSSIYLFGCNGGTGGQNSIAQTIANQTGAITYGYTSYTFFTNDRALGHFKRKPTKADVNRIVPRSNQLWLVPNNGRRMTRFTPIS